jgi:1,4-dihydroxy-2-naphthoyl-CoA hydrolase
MLIWFDKALTLSQLKAFGLCAMPGFLGMEWVEMGADYLKLKMPVNEKTKQVYGILHGGASCALAETVGSISSALVIDREKFACVGLEINANHIRSATQGFVTAICKPLHLGKSTHVWDIKIFDDVQMLICVSRLTVAIVDRSKLSFNINAGANDNISY